MTWILTPLEEMIGAMGHSGSHLLTIKNLRKIRGPFGKLSSGHRTGQGPFAFQSQRKAMPKNAQTTAQLHSSHTLAK